jgi:hypothetical protein
MRKSTRKLAHFSNDTPRASQIAQNEPTAAILAASHFPKLPRISQFHLFQKITERRESEFG